MHTPINTHLGLDGSHVRLDHPVQVTHCQHDSDRQHCNVDVNDCQDSAMMEVRAVARCWLASLSHFFLCVLPPPPPYSNSVRVHLLEEDR